MIIDISVPLTEDTTTWNDRESLHIEEVASIEQGDHSTNTRLELDTHTGTHVDAPAHFVKGGARMDAIGLDVLVGDAWVADLTGEEAITADVLEAASIPDDTLRLLCRTDNSEHWGVPGHAFKRDYVAITPDGGEWLVKRGIRLVGIDYLSIAPHSDTLTTHQIVLGAGIVALETLDLRNVKQGRYELLCLPLHLPKTEAAPVRAILRTKACL